MTDLARSGRSVRTVGELAEAKAALPGRNCVPHSVERPVGEFNHFGGRGMTFLDIRMVAGPCGRFDTVRRAQHGCELTGGNFALIRLPRGAASCHKGNTIQQAKFTYAINTSLRAGFEREPPGEAEAKPGGEIVEAVGLSQRLQWQSGTTVNPVRTRGMTRLTGRVKGLSESGLEADRLDQIVT